jgi:dTDP-4-dehydrorhamnose 3,5-epimerase-like enzyme
MRVDEAVAVGDGAVTVVEVDLSEANPTSCQWQISTSFSN